MLSFPMILLTWLCFTVWLIDGWFKGQHSYLICSGAYPNSTQSLQSTHYFQIYVANSLTQLIIEAPQQLVISQPITVVDQHYRRIDFVTHSTSTYLLIEFTQPIPPKKILSIAIHGIRNSTRSPRIWIYSLYSKNLSKDRVQITLLGIARIVTYASTCTRF